MSSASSPAPSGRLNIRAEVPVKFLPLLEGYVGGQRDLAVKRRRYYVAYGGRDSAKSWTFARGLVLLAMYDPLRVLCCREIQRTIADSVHRVLSDQIALLNAGDYYTVQDATITGRNSAEFLFAGLRGIDATKIKSFEACDIAGAEEAQAIVHKSWETLIPTIRAPQSEIWATFNPDLDTDDTYERFLVHPPADAWVQKVTWEDNPWFSAVLDNHRREMERDDPEEYRHVYGGLPRTTVVGAIYGNEVRAMIEGHRYRPIPYDPRLPVHTIWDLGWNDAMTIILAQKPAPSAINVIGYIEDSFRTYAEYVAQLNGLKYVWGTDWLPHDGGSKDPKAGKSAKQILEGLGRRVRLIPRGDVETGIKAVRMMFPRVYVDDSRLECETGYLGAARLMDCLKRYRRAVPESTGEPGHPVHDEYSHGADAWRGLAVIVDQISNDNEAPLPRQRPPRPHVRGLGM